jgi:two-component system chemotaxis response regulator CheB
MTRTSYKAIVMGTSAGGMQALTVILGALPATFPLPIIIVQHMNEQADGFLAEYLNRLSHLRVKEAEDKEPLKKGTVYLAPAGYHLLVEADLTLGLSVDPRVNYSCPSIDVLFESASDAFEETLIGVVLTGANSDGSKGLKIIKERGGLAIVQDPHTATARAMPDAAIAAMSVDHVVALACLAPLLMDVITSSHEEKGETHASGTHG